MANVSTWTGRVGRLISMRRHELFDRMLAGEHVTARTDMLRCCERSRLVQAIRKSNHAVRNGRFFFTPEDLAPLVCCSAEASFSGQRPMTSCSGRKQIAQHRFDLLGYENLDYGAEDRLALRHGCMASTDHANPGSK